MDISLKKKRNRLAQKPKKKKMRKKRMTKKKNTKYKDLRLSSQKIKK